MNVRFIAAAQDELDEAVEYYNVESAGLGDEFLVEVLQTIDRIKQLPEAWAKLSDNTRRCVTRRFPYGVIYQHSPNELLIVAVAHLHGKPGYWKERL